MNRVKFPAFLVFKVCRLGVFLIVLCLMPCESSPAYGKEALPVKVAIVISKNIKPYLEAVEGFQAGLTDNADVSIRLFNLEDLADVGPAEAFGEEDEKEFALFAAVGPEAAQYIWTRIGGKAAPNIYCMVLNPEKVVGEEEKACGISLNIPVQAQMEMISRGLPFVRRLGILHDPEHNTGFLHDAAEAAPSLNLTVVPIDVSSKKDIPLALEGQWKHLDALWLIPDRTVISESIVTYLIKEAFFKKVPVIGYNRFFYETGAALAFVFDYRELGRQCAHEALRMLSGEDCRETPPRFRVWVNEKMMEKLGRRPPNAYLPPLQPGP
jgi:putative tryptophan/tyrosine transport system substrate-binding protein